MTQVAVYELLVNDEVVYIGATTNPHRRCFAHRANLNLAAWPQIRVLHWCRTRGSALRLEARLIRKHRPPLNVQQAQRRRAQREDIDRARKVWTTASRKMTNREVLGLMPAGWTAQDARAAFGSRYAAE